MADPVFQEMLDTLDMEFYLDREGIEYKHRHGASGDQLNIEECPFCGGDGWKTFMNADSGLGNCFHGSCGTTFNKYGFIKAHIDASGFGAVRDHINEAVREQGWRPKRTISRVTESEGGACILPIHQKLPIDGRNLAYLEGRGIGLDIATYFQLGYCHNGFFLFTKNGKAGWQSFAGRILIPVFDIAGKLVTFQGRDITGASAKKYLFPIGLPGTGRYLYNGNNALGCERVCMVEGAFDVMATKIAFDADITLRGVGVVGSFGKHLSTGAADGNDQVGALAKLKARGTRELTIMWDGEKTAMDAAINAASLAWQIGLKTRVALLPKGADPNEVSGDLVRRAFSTALSTSSTRDMMKLRVACPYR